MTQVGIIRTNLTSVVSDLETLLGMINYRPKKEKILLKPNIVVAEPPENGSITHPKLMEALVHYFRKRDREVVIAEGTGIFADDRDFERLLHSSQYAPLRNQLGVPIINLERAETEKIPWQYGSLHIPKLLKDHEYINVPTMKTHGQTMVTLGVKNQKGLLPMKMKKMFHKRDLQSAILALCEVFRPTLTVVDGIYCVEGNGPTGPPVGEVKRMDLLVGGTDMMAVDNVCVDIMGFDIEGIRHLKSVNDIEILGVKVGDVKSGFKVPTIGTMRLGPFVFYSDDRVCTMCTVSIYKALSKIFGTPELQRQLGSREDLSEIHIIMGQAKPPAELAGCTFCLGDCATKTAKRMGLPHIKGCHPDYKNIVKSLFPRYYSEPPPVNP